MAKLEQKKKKKNTKHTSERKRFFAAVNYYNNNVPSIDSVLSDWCHDDYIGLHIFIP